ncbi:MAG TPA: hypothetical protein VF717_06225, partial [Pyrinomonadaceae bacterium]
MHHLNKKSYALLLALAVVVITVPPTTLHSQNQYKPGRMKRAAALRREGQPATPPTAQEATGLPVGAVITRAFRSARSLLLKKGVPFEPNLLLERNWHARLRDALAEVPEFHEIRRGGRKLKGAQIADTLFLPERIELDGDTVIVAKRLIFEGRNVVIKGNHDIHIFTVEPATLTEQATEGNQVQILNAGFNDPSWLRSLASTLRPVQSGNITIDTSGSGRREWLESQRRNRPGAAARSAVRMVKAGFERGARSALSQESEDASGQRGVDGVNGEGGLPGDNGRDGANGLNGICGGNVNGGQGEEGGYGIRGNDGEDGRDGEDGGDARNITINVRTGYTYMLIANGGDGGNG